MTRTERTKIGTIETRLSIAIKLQDAFTGGQPTGPLRVGLFDRSERFIRNRSGYYVLTDLPEEISPVAITVEPGDRYLLERCVLDQEQLESLPQVLTITLLPAPAYRFPADATLIRGMVGEARDDGTVTPLSDVELTVDTDGDASDDDTALSAMGRSNNDGEYVLFFRGVTADDVSVQDDDSESDSSGRTVVRVNGETPTVRATHPETDRETTVQTAVEAGTTTALDITF